MVFCMNEIEALLLLRWCHFIPVKDLRVIFSKTTIETLQAVGYITVNEKYKAYILTNQGNRFLSQHFDHIPPPTRRTYRESNVAHRIVSSRFTLCAYQAGLSVFTTEQSEIETEAAFYLTALSRTARNNPWGSSRVIALVHLGDMICGVYPIESNNTKVSLNDEMTAFNNNTARFRCKKRGIIFTSKSYEAIHSALNTSDTPGKAKYISYGDFYARTSLPTFLIPWNDTGAMQLHMMLHSDFRVRMTLAALGSHWVAPPEENSEWDAIYEDVPQIMAADMNLKRIDAAILSAQACGRAPVCLSALSGQAVFLRKRYKPEGLVKKVVTFSSGKDAVREELTLHTPSDRLFVTKKGAVIHAPPIKNAGKA